MIFLFVHGNNNFITHQTNRVMTLTSTYTGDDSAPVSFLFKLDLQRRKTAAISNSCLSVVSY